MLDGCLAHVFHRLPSPEPTTQTDHASSLPRLALSSLDLVQQDMEAKPPAWASLAAGQLSGVAGLCAAYPLDTIKVRIQTVAKSSNMLEVVSSMLRKEGVCGQAYMRTCSAVL